MGLNATGELDRSTLDAIGFRGANLEQKPSADLEAYKIALRANEGRALTAHEIQYALTIAKGEGGYGRGWANPSAATIAASAKFGLTGYEGAGSNNWGAVQGTGNAGSFPHVDYHADGSAYVGKFRKYLTPEDGFLDVCRVLYSGGKRKEVGAKELRDALNRGDLSAAVYAQHANGYFELEPMKYLSAVRANYEKLTAALGWPTLLTGAPKNGFLS
jgi:hypothetical protein